VNVTIRPWKPEDAEALLEAARESWSTVGPWLPWCHEGYTLDEARAWCENDEPRHEFAIVADDGRLLGGCGLNAIDPVKGRANLGYWVRPSARGCGAAPQAVLQLIDFAREKTDLRWIVVLVAVENAASLRVAEKIGAVRQKVSPGRLPLHGKRHDAVVFTIELAR
jgi:ribosomal-protein-serine acetyltransferase